MKKKYVITIIKIKSIIIIIYEIIFFILYNRYTIELDDVRFFFLMSWLIINYLLFNLKDNYGGFINYLLFNLKDYHVK